MYRETIILCIGCEKVMGDMLGPLTGEELMRGGFPGYIYGTTNNPVNGINIREYINFIKRIHPESLIISVDAAVGGREEIGQIKLKDTGVDAGAALERGLKVDGLGIIGVVGDKKGNVMHNLMSADPQMIIKMSRKIAKIILKSVNQVEMRSSLCYNV
jgi:putative sporulation protein YyaC